MLDEVKRSVELRFAQGMYHVKGIGNKGERVDGIA
jgi:hypothetical protein